MKVIIAAIVMLLIGCSAKQQQAERSVPQCLSLCGNQFAACTEEFPGDASACLPARRDCERTCQGEAAVRRAEDGRPSMTVTEKPKIIRPDMDTPDAGAASPADSGQAVD